MKKIAPILAAAFLAACSAATTPAPVTQPLRFLLINDVYFGDTLRDGSGGLARVASLRDSLAKTGPVTFVLAGDFPASSNETGPVAIESSSAVPSTASAPT